VGWCGVGRGGKGGPPAPGGGGGTVAPKETII